ncbi:hypothetical protein B0H19DRAFT_1086152 [Mycena capillaripes]|nr:hypothetical protein B0H19DRAFT_1086152 [Mycena capillaripes]
MSSLDSTLGALELGGVLGTLLFGITSVQTFSYYRDYPRDALLLRTVVGMLWIFEFVHTVLVWHGIYSMTVTFYGQPEHLASPPPTLASTLVSETVIVAVVQISEPEKMQIYFINRIRLVSKKWLLPALCSILTLFRAGACVAMLAVVLLNSNLFILSERFRWLMCASLGSGTAVDVLVTVALCYYLWQARASRFKKTRRMADKLITWSIESTAVKRFHKPLVFDTSFLITS